jgi:hypothetical protein
MLALGGLRKKIKNMGEEVKKSEGSHRLMLEFHSKVY